ncbi:MGMT family protein [Frateuria aurantia]
MTDDTPDDDAARWVAKIRETIAAVPAGQTCSYGVIARRAGVPGPARLVGRVLREAPPSLALPWHRVVRADGRPAFAPGSDAYQEQVRRLQAEGVSLTQGRVDVDFRAQVSNLDALLWRPEY